LIITWWKNSIRPFVLGLKNWLFSGTPEGAQASAQLYSLIETAKANKLEPYAYLRYVFEKLPVAETLEDYRPCCPGILLKNNLPHQLWCHVLNGALTQIPLKRVFLKLWLSAMTAVYCQYL